MFLEVKNVTKEIGSDVVLNDITLSMEKGKVYGVQGKNGCGKSMLMRVICGLVLPSQGSIVVNGETLGVEISFPRSVGVLIEKPGFLESYTGFDNLKMLASIQGKVKEEEIVETLKRVGLEENMNKKFRKYSLGMKQKLGIAAAIMEKPELLILDEPTNALDEKSELQFWKIIQEEKERGALVLISCHDSEQLERVCDCIYRMDHGRIIGEGGHR